MAHLRLPGATPASTASRAFHITARIAAGLAGGYGFTWGFCALGIVMLARAGMGFEEAQKLVALLAFLLYLTLFCWSFAARRIGLLWLVLAGGGSAMGAAAWWLQRGMA